LAQANAPVVHHQDFVARDAAFAIVSGAADCLFGQTRRGTDDRATPAVSIPSPHPY